MSNAHYLKCLKWMLNIFALSLHHLLFSVTAYNGAKRVHIRYLKIPKNEHLKVSQNEISVICNELYAIFSVESKRNIFVKLYVPICHEWMCHSHYSCQASMK